MILTQNIIVHSTDEVTSYPDPKTFLDNMVNYLKIESQLPAGLGMISIGQDAPDQQYQDIPWLELDDNNNPLALKYYNGVEWMETRPYRAIEAPYEGLYVQYGSITVDHKQATPNTWVDSIMNWTATPDGRFQFPEPFKAGTSISIQITPVVSGVFERSPGTANLASNSESKIEEWANARVGFEWCLGSNINYQGFNVKTKSLDALPAGIPFKFNWMAMGEKA